MQPSPLTNTARPLSVQTDMLGGARMSCMSFVVVALTTVQAELKQAYEPNFNDTPRGADRRSRERRHFAQQLKWAPTTFDRQRARTCGTY